MSIGAQSNAPIDNNIYSRSTGTTSSDVFITVFSNRDPTPYDFNYSVKKRWINTTLIKEWYLESFYNNTGPTLANWVLLAEGSSVDAILSLSDNVDTKVFPDPTGNIKIEGQLNQQSGFFSTTVADVAGFTMKTNPMSSSRWIVDPLSTLTNPNGTHTTIDAAMGDAVSGDTIMIMPGIYIEDFVMKAGVNIVAFQGDQFTPNVTIQGTVTFASTGTASISNVRLETNAANCLTVSGSAASIVNLNGCCINCTNNTGISFTTSNASAQIVFTDCTADVTTTGIAHFASSSTGTLNFVKSRLINSGGSSTANTISAGLFTSSYSRLTLPVTSSGTAAIIADYVFFSGQDQNITALTIGGSTASQITNSGFASGSAIAVTLSGGAVLGLVNCNISSTNSAAISGTGTLNYVGVEFSGPGATITTSTANALGPEYSSYRQPGAYPYTVLDADSYIAVDSSATAKTINLPNSSFVGRKVTIKDRTGNAAANNITVTTPGGAVLIDGATTYVMATNYQAAGFIWNGTAYEVFAM